MAIISIFSLRLCVFATKINNPELAIIEHHVGDFFGPL